MYKKIMKKFLKYSLVFIILSAFIAPTVFSDKVKNFDLLFNDQLDQYQTTNDFNIAWIYEGNLWAQSFKPSLNKLTKVELLLRDWENPPTDDVTVSIRDSLNGEDMVSITKNASFFNSSFQWIEFDFNDITVFTNDTYYIVGTSNSVVYKEYQWGASISDLYDRGKAFVSYNGGDIWCLYYFDKDLCFKTYGYNGEVNPPQVHIDFPENDDIVLGETSIIGSAHSSSENFSLIQIKIDDGEWQDCTGATSWSYEWDTSNVPDGYHSISARGFTGTNFTEIEQIYVWVNNDCCNVPPMVEITYPPDYSTVNGIITFTGIARDIDGKIQSVQIRVDNDEWKTCTGTKSWTYEMNTKDIPDGWYTITLRSFDGDKYSLTDSITLYFYNNLKPTVKITRPRNGAWCFQSAYVEGTAHAQIGDIEFVEAKFDTEPWSLCSGKEDWHCTFNLKGYPSGTYYIYARSYDGLQYSEIKSIYVVKIRARAQILNKVLLGNLS